MYNRDETRRFIVLLPKKPNAEILGESRSLAVQRFLWLEQSLHSKNKFDEFANAMEEYFEMGHAECVPSKDLDTCEEVFYLPMHVVSKVSSTTTRLHDVFNASAKTKSGMSLNDQLFIGPTIHAPLLDILLGFH